jgi:hypothetical protein
MDSESKLLVCDARCMGCLKLGSRDVEDMGINNL